MEEVRDTALDLALFAAGWKAFGNPIGSLVGPISLKLAQTEGGLGSPSQIAGVAGLIILGVAFGGNSERPPEEAFYPVQQPDPSKPMIRATIKGGLAICPEGYVKVNPYPGIVMCQKTT